MDRHPKYAEALRACGGDEKKAGQVIQLYQQLTEVQGWWDVKIHAGSDGVPVFLSGCTSCHAKRSAVLPLPADRRFSIADLERLQEGILLEDGSRPEGLTLAFMETDSTAASYTMATGLVPPETPDIQDAKKQRVVGRHGRRARHVNAQIQRYHAVRAGDEF